MQQPYTMYTLNSIYSHLSLFPLSEQNIHEHVAEAFLHGLHFKTTIMSHLHNVGIIVTSELHVTNHLKHRSSMANVAEDAPNM